MRSPTRACLLSLSSVALYGCASAQTVVGRSDSVYTWRGSLPSRSTLSVRNFNGPIDVRPSESGSAEVRAEKRTSRGGGSLQDVTFDVESGSGGDVTICSVYRSRNSCDGDRAGRRSNRDDDDDGGRSVTVAMTVYVPRGTHLRVATGNGALSVDRVAGDVQASTGNGRVRVDGTEGTVRVSTGNGDVDVRDARAPVRVNTGNGYVNVSTSEGPVDAHTGNGSIDVTMSSLRARDDMSFSTGSGAVRVTLPSGYNGELDASTGNGEIRSDFELRVQGRMNPRRIRATIGNGGPSLRLTTGNGALVIRKQ